MFFDQAGTREISRTDSGNLKEIPFAPLLFSYYRHEWSLKLDILEKGVTTSITLNRGNPVDCRSDDPNDNLAGFLLSAGKLTRAEFRRVMGESNSGPDGIVDALVRMKLVNMHEVPDLLRLKLCYDLSKFFPASASPFLVTRTRQTCLYPIKVTSIQILLDGITNYVEIEQIYSGLGPLVGKPLTINPGSANALRELQLSPEQVRIVGALRSKVRIDELASLAATTIELVTRTVYALAMLDIVMEVSSGNELEMTLRKQRMSAGAPVYADELKCEEYKKFQREVLGIHLNIAEKSPEELLDFPPDGKIQLLKKSYLEFAQKYAPWPHDNDKALKAKLLDIFLAGAGAYVELANQVGKSPILGTEAPSSSQPAGQPPSRPAPRPSPPTSQRQFSSTPPRRSSPGGPNESSGSISPMHRSAQASEKNSEEGAKGVPKNIDVYFKRAQKLMSTGNFVDALKSLNTLVEMSPNVGHYQSTLAFCRCQVHPSAVQRSLDTLRKVMLTDPLCGIAQYYAGLIEKDCGNTPEALRLFAAAAGLMPGDNRPVEELTGLLRATNMTKS